MAESEKYKLLKCVKYGDTPYKAGEKISIADADLEEFESKGIIEIDPDTENQAASPAIDPAAEAEMVNLAARCEALKLDLPDGLTIEQVRAAVEKAEQEQKEKGKA